MIHDDSQIFHLKNDFFFYPQTCQIEQIDK
jgi:hypothetical protein